MDEKELFMGDGTEEEFDTCGQECYEFNEQLGEEMDDNCCEHCKKFLTTSCEHLGEFMDEIEDI